MVVVVVMVCVRGDTGQHCSLGYLPPGPPCPVTIPSEAREPSKAFSRHQVRTPG